MRCQAHGMPVSIAVLAASGLEGDRRAAASFDPRHSLGLPSRLRGTVCKVKMNAPFTGCLLTNDRELAGSGHLADTVEVGRRGGDARVHGASGWPPRGSPATRTGSV